MSGLVEKVKAKVDAVLHKDGHHDTTHSGTHTGTHTGAHTGTHTGTGTGIGGHSHSTNAGPHDTNTANKLDPRVDSDRDGRSGLGGQGSHHVGGIGNANTTHSTSGLGGISHPHSTTSGPHSSNLANKLDPRVDSDRDGSSTLGGNTHSTTGYNTSTTSGGYGSTGYATNAGPHDSNLLNKADPRVDSDRDGRSGLGGNTHNTTGYNTSTTSGGYGTHTQSGGLGSNTTAGPHDSNLLNKLDPRVDSDRDGQSGLSGNTGNTYNSSATSGGYGTHTQSGGLGSNTTSGSGLNNVTGTAPNTTGPHSTDIANKLDPRVDSTSNTLNNTGRY